MNIRREIFKNLLRLRFKRFIKDLIYPPLSLTPPLPSTVWIDPINICNLKCVLCPTAMGELKHAQTKMSFNTFKRILQKMPSVKRIELYNWGESFLNEDIFKIIKHATEYGIKVAIHSNFSFKKSEDFFIEIIESGLYELTISLDGNSQESYSIYRKGGNYKQVISNIETLLCKKTQLKSDRPKITWKFIVNRFNQQEVENAKNRASVLGVEFHIDGFDLGDLCPDKDYNINFEQRKKDWLPSNIKYTLKRYHGIYKYPPFEYVCPFLFKFLVVTPEGKVFPCCYLIDKKNAFGDLLNESLEDIWYNHKYKYSRSLFLKHKYHMPKISTICSYCKNYMNL